MQVILQKYIDRIKDKKIVERYLTPKWLYIALMLSFIATTTLQLKSEGGYWHDEAILTDISKQEVPIIMDILEAEPHPPLMYLFLKLLPVDNYNITKVAITIASYLILFIAVIYGDTKGIIKKHKLELGILLYCISPIGQLLVTNVKQDAITVPLVILGIFVFIDYWDNKNTKSLWLLSLIASTTLFIGYINFARIVFLLTLATLQKITKKTVLPLISTGIITLTYFVTWGETQLRNNLTRFTWYKDNYQGILNVAEDSIGGILKIKETIFMADIFLLVFLYFVIRYIVLTENEAHKRLFRVYLVLIFVYFSILGVARSRYVFDAAFIFFIFVGWGIDHIHRNIGKYKLILLNAFVISYFIGGLISHYVLDVNAGNYRRYHEYVAEISKDKKTGLIAKHPITVFVGKIRFNSNDENVIPINPNYYIKVEDHVTKELLMQDGNFNDIPKEEIIENLRDTQLERFIYSPGVASSGGGQKGYYDPDQKVLETLNEYCESSKILEFKGNLFMVFDNCGNTK